jgi:hypothetical protein
VHSEPLREGQFTSTTPLSLGTSTGRADS